MTRGQGVGGAREEGGGEWGRGRAACAAPSFMAACSCSPAPIASAGEKVGSGEGVGVCERLFTQSVKEPYSTKQLTSSSPHCSPALGSACSASGTALCADGPPCALLHSSYYYVIQLLLTSNTTATDKLALSAPVGSACSASGTVLCAEPTLNAWMRMQRRRVRVCRKVWEECGAQHVV